MGEDVKPMNKRVGGAPRIEGPVTHALKCDAGYFEAVELGHKTSELRINDRDFRMHDHVVLHELEYERLTGRTIERRITHIVWDSNGPWLAPGYCMLSLGPINSHAELEAKAKLCDRMADALYATRQFIAKHVEADDQRAESSCAAALDRIDAILAELAKVET